MSNIDIELIAREMADNEAAERDLEPYSDISWAAVRGKWISKVAALRHVHYVIAERDEYRRYSDELFQAMQFQSEALDRKVAEIDELRRELNVARGDDHG